MNVQNDLLLDGVMTAVTALDKHSQIGRMFVWSQAIRKAGLRSSAIGQFFYQVTSEQLLQLAVLQPQRWNRNFKESS